MRNCRLTKFVFAAGRRIARVVTEDPVLAPYGLDSFSPYTFLFHQDHLGSVSAVTDDTGEVVSALSYHPYGSIEREHTDPSLAAFSSDQKYTDKELDEELGLVYFGARYYWAESGRWVSPDPLFLGDPAKGTENAMSLYLYSYGMNNPTVRIDPHGTDSFVLTWPTESGGTGLSNDAHPAFYSQFRSGYFLRHPGCTRSRRRTGWLLWPLEIGRARRGMTIERRSFPSWALFCISQI